MRWELQMLGGKEMFYYTDNPVRDAERYYGKLEDETERRPKCECCGFPIIEDTAYRIGRTFYCEDCMLDEFAVDVEDLMEEEW